MPDPAALSTAKDHPRRWAGLAVLSISLLLVVTANITLTVALGDLARELGATTSELQWILDAYPLAMAALLFALGAAGEKYGRRGALLLGLVGFGAFSVLGAVGDSPEQLIAARTGLGVSAALIMPATLGLIRVTFSDEERPRALALWSASAGLGLAAGPLLSGSLVEPYGWEAAFYLNIPLVVVLLTVAVPLLPASRNEDAGKLDPLGAVLSCLLLGGLVYGVIEGPVEGWTSVQVLGAWAVALVSLVCFIAVELRVSDPMLDLRWFLNRHFAAGAGFSLVTFTVLVGVIYLITLFLQQLLGEDALGTGLRLLPAGLAIIVGAPAGEQLHRRFGPKWPIAAGLSLAAAGAAVLASVDVSTDAQVVMVAGILVGLGGGLAIPSMTESVMANAPTERGSVAGATFDASIEVGAALGIAVFGSVLTSVYSDQLPDRVVAQLPPEAREAAQDSLGAALGVAQQMPDAAAGPLVAAARDAFTDGFAAAAIALIVLASAGAVLAALVAPGRTASKQSSPAEAEAEAGAAQGPPVA